MATLGSIRAAVRRDLHDEEPTSYRWTDEVLNRHIQRAVREVGQRAPRERKTTLLTTPGSRDLSIASLSERLQVVAVEWPAGLWPRQIVRHQVHGDTLTLLVDVAPAAEEPVFVYWTSLHTVDATTSTLPAQLEEVVASGAAGYAALEQTFFTTNRVNVGGRTVPLDFRKLAEERIGAFQAELKRLDRSRSPRPMFLYVAD
jgi:hypothetical protein